MTLPCRFRAAARQLGRPANRALVAAAAAAEGYTYDCVRLLQWLRAEHALALIGEVKGETFTKLILS